MDKPDARRRVLARALLHVPFEGWTQGVLERGAEESGFARGEWVRIFPGGVSDALAFFVAEADRRMREAWANTSPQPSKIRERIALLVRLRLESYTPHREAVRRALAWYALPPHAAEGVKTLAHTASALWYAAGDTATDFNWYTKRALLASVYMSTLLFWLNDESDGQQGTWEFLARRIDNVMQIQRLKGRILSFPRKRQST